MVKNSKGCCQHGSYSQWKWILISFFPVESGDESRELALVFEKSGVWKLGSYPLEVKNKKSGAMTLKRSRIDFLHVGAPIHHMPQHLKSWEARGLTIKKKNQASISSLLKGSIGSSFIFTCPQKWSKTRFWGLLTPFLSKTGGNSLLLSPDSDSTGKNLSKSVIIV